MQTEDSVTEPKERQAPPGSEQVPLTAENIDQPLQAELVSTKRGSPALIATLALASVMFLWTVAPIAAPALLGALLAAAATPLHKRLSRHIHHPSWSASLVTLALVLLVLVPLGAIVSLVVSSLNSFVVSAEGQELFSGRFMQKTLANHPSWARYVPKNVTEQVANAMRWLGQSAPALFTGFTNVVIGLFLTIITTYFLLRDGPQLYAHVERTLPLEARHTRAIANEFSQVGRSFFIGTLGTAALQGIAGGVGYVVLDLPQPVLLGALTAIGAIVPMLGSGVVWGPAAVILIATGSTTKGIILIVFGMVVVASLDNVVRPILQRGGSDIHPLFFFLAIFGGLAAFGAAGLYMGPLFVSLFVAVARIYESEIAGPLPKDADRRSRWRLVIQRLSRRG